MSHGLLWLPLLLVFVLLVALGWLERRRQNLFRDWAQGAELAKLDTCGAARLVDGVLSWSRFEAGKLQDEDSFVIKHLELVELLSLHSGEAPLTAGQIRRMRITKAHDYDLTGELVDTPQTPSKLVQILQ